MRSVHSSGATSRRLTASKSKVAPLTANKYTSTRIDGSHAGSEVSKAVVKLLKMDLEKVTFWTDGSNVLLVD